MGQPASKLSIGQQGRHLSSIAISRALNFLNSSTSQSSVPANSVISSTRNLPSPKRNYPVVSLRTMGTKGGGRRGGRGAGSDVVMSKALSYTLRHGAQKEGLPLRPDGYARVTDLLAMPKFRKLNLDFEALKRLVRESDKKRFRLILTSEVDKPAGKDSNASTASSGSITMSITTTIITTSTSTAPDQTDSEEFSQITPALKSLNLGEDNAIHDSISQETDAIGESTWTSPNPSDYLIRANQGHSIEITSASLNLTLITPENLPAKCVHGTFYAAWELILASGGLKPMGRIHIHFAPGLPGEGQVISGMRRDVEVLVYVDILKAIKESEGRIKFWKSANEVILTEGDQEKGGLLELEYVEKVEDIKNGLGTLWEEGNLVKELPPSFRGRKLPIGKERLGKYCRVEETAMGAQKENGRKPRKVGI